MIVLKTKSKVPHKGVLMLRLNHTICLLLAAFATCAAPSHAQQDSSLLKPYRAVYVAGYQFLPFKAKAIRELSHSGGNRWVLSDTVKSAIVKVNEHSEFSWQNGVPVPHQYRYILGGLAKNRDEAVTFDWKNNIATSEYKRGTYMFELEPGVQDKLTYQLKLRNDLMTSGSVGSYPVASRREIRALEFVIEGEEVIETSLGTFKTVRVARSRDPEDDRETQVWLAPEWDYLMIKLRQTENGKTYEIVLDEGELDGKPILGNKKE